MGAARAAAGGEGGEAMGTHDVSQNLIVFVTFEASWSGGYKEMSSILADQQRPSYMSPRRGGAWVLRGLSQ